MKSSTKTRACFAVVASAALLWALVLSASPRLHERIHADANRVDHACAVTFIASGNFNHAPVSILISAPVSYDVTKVPERTPLWIQPLFLLASVFEHAPPANS
ncbi:MAG: hypothetical protein DME57_01760 [Verrucomicrobia bacterium]|nr:MAG: hypothetical protein DME57_01760 [Verrucomicrobiota bacterium]